MLLNASPVAEALLFLVIAYPVHPWPIKVELVNVSIPKAEYEYLKQQTVRNHMLQPEEGDDGGE